MLALAVILIFLPLCATSFSFEKLTYQRFHPYQQLSYFYFCQVSIQNPIVNQLYLKDCSVYSLCIVKRSFINIPSTASSTFPLLTNILVCIVVRPYQLFLPSDTNDAIFNNLSIISNIILLSIPLFIGFNQL